MNCTDVSTLLDPFLDTELPPPMLLAVARHAGTCTTCDTAIREMTELRELVARGNATAVDGLDFRGVWSAVEAGIDRHDAALARSRRLRALPMWGTMAAMAAGLLLWMGQIAPPKPQPQSPARQQIARADRTMERDNKSILSNRKVDNHTYIDRLRAERAVDVRREPKSGTTVVWVNHTEDAGR
jgi:hypothetical protein